MIIYIFICIEKKTLFINYLILLGANTINLLRHYLIQVNTCIGNKAIKIIM